MKSDKKKVNLIQELKNIEFNKKNLGQEESPVKTEEQNNAVDWSIILSNQLNTDEEELT